ncbi:MAG: S41 family peptidase [Bacteroidales bacterium]
MRQFLQKYPFFLPFILLLFFAGGLYLGKYISAKEHQNKIITGTQGNKITDILEMIEDEFVDSIDMKNLIEDVIPLILEKLDPHSGYIPEKDFNEVNDPIEGEFEGIGVQFNIIHDTVVVIQVIPGGPSERANVRAGDRIIYVNDSIIAGIGIDSYDVVKKLKGPKNTKVKIGIKRNKVDSIITFILTRDKIPFYSIDASFMSTPTIGYIKISRFATTTYSEFMKHSKELKSQGMKSLILDLRGNGGGVLSEAALIANEFLEKRKLIVYTEGRAYSRETFYSDGRGSLKDIELYILVDENTASASEILSGAIQDNDRGTIVGRRTFGKGLVMTQKKFKDGSAIRLSIAHYYTPSGRCIQKPYTKNHQDYYLEIRDRYVNGQMQNKDSITFPDSLKYFTKAGRVVYGGGGIMPDYFIPLDTTGYSTFYSVLINKGILYDYAFDYTDKYREELKAFKNGNEIVSYLEQNNFYNEFLKYCHSQNIKPTSKELQTSGHLIKHRLYSYIIRNCLGDNDFYKHWLKNDQPYNFVLEKLFK